MACIEEALAALHLFNFCSGLQADAQACSGLMDITTTALAGLQRRQPGTTSDADPDTASLVSNANNFYYIVFGDIFNEANHKIGVVSMLLREEIWT